MLIIITFEVKLYFRWRTLLFKSRLWSSLFKIFIYGHLFPQIHTNLKNNFNIKKKNIWFSFSFSDRFSEAVMIYTEWLVNWLEYFFLAFPLKDLIFELTSFERLALRDDTKNYVPFNIPLVRILRSHAPPCTQIHALHSAR